jgi:DNA-binding protein HU-beta
VNKAELIDALAVRLGEKKTATAALDAVLAEVQAAVTKGDKVSITGFGVFEKRVRAARMARNPRTGEAVKVKKTSIPAFRAGAGFKDMVATGKAPKAPAPAKKAAGLAKAATKTAAKAPAKTATKTAAKSTAKATPAKKAATKTAAAKKTAPAKTAPARKATTTVRKAATAKATTATKATAAKKAPAKTATTAKKAPAKKAAR